MNVQFLASLIKANNRIVVPSLGAFLHKENGSVVFSPFLNKDDGLLQSAVCRRFNLSAAQAQAQIDAFCEEVRGSLSTIGKFYIDSVGILVVNPNGGISLIEEEVKPVEKPKVTEPINIPSIDPLLSQINRNANPINTNFNRENFNEPEKPVQPSTQPLGQQIAQLNVTSGASVNVPNQPVQARPQNIPPRPVAAPRSQPSWVSPASKQPNPIVGNVVNPTQGTPAGQPAGNKMQPDNSRMGQPAGRPVARPMQEGQTNQVRPMGNNGNQPKNRPQQSGKPNGKTNRPNPNTSKSSMDIWLVVAIIAAILVVILIIYGLIYTDPAKQMF